MSGYASPELILAAAARAFALRGYHGMSMRELGRALGRSPASFYHHFESKEDLLFSVQHRAFEALLAATEHALTGVENPNSRLYIFIANHVRAFAAHPDVMRVLVHEAAALPATRRAIVRRQKQAYFEIGRRLVADLVYGDTREVIRSTYCLFGMLNWMYGWYQPERHGGPRELSRTIYRIACGGLASVPLALPDLDSLDQHLDSIELPALLQGGPSHE